MRRFCFAIGLLAVLIGAIASAGAGESMMIGARVTVMRTMLGCIDQADTDRLIRLALSKDVAAFERLYNDMLVRFRCVPVVKGLDYYVDETTLWQLCLRVPGRTACLWAPISAVDR